jgi:hypothetical protein
LDRRCLQRIAYGLLSARNADTCVGITYNPITSSARHLPGHQVYFRCIYLVKNR